MKKILIGLIIALFMCGTYSYATDYIELED